MIDLATRALFQQQASKGAAIADIEALARRIKTGVGSPTDAAHLAAAFAHAAFMAPGRIAEIYDAASTGWFNAAVEGCDIMISPEAPAPLSDEFWMRFWRLTAQSTRLGSGDVTSQAADLSRLLDPTHQPRVAAASSAYPSVLAAAAAGFPDRIQLAELAACPSGSLGKEFYNLIVDNNFDLEVLDRDALGLAGLPAPLDYLNARMLQSHDLWHIVAGYKTTKLHEVAISAFQMAQFGHGYSALFLVIVETMSAFADVPPFPMMMDTILSAWVHGRRTPPMLLIPWEKEWGCTTADIRSRHGVQPYASPYPADIFERYEAAA